MSRLRTIPTAPGGLPLLGHVVPLLRDPFGFLESLPDHGELVRIRFGPVPAFVACTPELTRKVLLDDSTYDKGGVVIDRAREVLGHGLATCPHSAHRRQRRLVQPSFHPSRLPEQARVMSEEAEAVARAWHDGETVDVLRQMTILTSRTLMAAMFADALPTSAVSEMIDDMGVLFAGFYWRMIMPSPLRRLPLPFNRRYDRALSRRTATVRRLIADHRKDDAKHDDLLSVLLSTRDPEDPGGRHAALSDAELDGQLITFLAVGMTTSDVMSWVWYELARHPDVRERLHAEVDQVLAGSPVTFDDLPKLELTGRIVREALRLYPPSWLFTRRTTTEVTLGGHTLPAGTNVAVSPYLVQRLPAVYADPDRFDPDRWCTSPPSKAGFIPFGAGPRKCIGDRFGTAMATVVLATIAAHWTLDPVPGRPVRPELSVLLHPRHLTMRATRRRTAA